MKTCKDWSQLDLAICLLLQAVIACVEGLWHQISFTGVEHGIMYPTQICFRLCESSPDPYLFLPVYQLTINLMHSWAAGLLTDYLLLLWRLTSDNSNLPPNLPSKNTQPHWPFGQRLIFPSWESCMFSFNWLKAQIKSCRRDSWVKRSLVYYWYSCSCKEMSCCLAPWFYNWNVEREERYFYNLTGSWHEHWGKFSHFCYQHHP